MFKKTKEVRAVKIIDKERMDEQERVRLKYEVEILKNLYHANIVRIYEVYENETTIFIVTELCEGKELFEEISSRKKFNEKEAAIVTKQILQAIAYCHDQKICHRDLKPENILIDTANNGAIKIIDFGTSQVMRNNAKMHQVYGTAYYIAPEVLKGNYTEKCDLWSIGVIVYIMLSGKPPFPGKTDEAIIERVKEGTYQLSDKEWANIT